jgi:hypothetical protein
MNAAEFSISSPWGGHRWASGALFAVAAFILYDLVRKNAAHPLAITLASISIVAALVINVPAKVTVGVDGVLVRWLWTRQIHPLCNLGRAQVVLGDRSTRVRPIIVRLHRKDAVDQMLAIAAGTRYCAPFVDLVASTYDARYGPSKKSVERAVMIADRINETIQSEATVVVR